MLLAMIYPLSYIQFGLTPSQTGLLFLTISVPYIIFASVGGRIADKIVRLISAFSTQHLALVC